MRHRGRGPRVNAERGDVNGGSLAYDDSERYGKVIPLARQMLVQISHPRSFNDAQAIGDRLKGGAVVIVVLQDADRDLAGRNRDFAFGLAAAREGAVAQGGDGILVLTPPGVSVTGAQEDQPATV